MLAAEVADGSRIVARTELFTAFVPFAARWPVEVHIYPNRFVHNLLDLTDAELDGFAQIYLDVLAPLRPDVFGPLPYMSALHQYADTPALREGYFHVELMSIRRSASALKYLAASESAMDAFITDVVPEAVAAAAAGSRVTIRYSAPGRINLIGEHTDYNLGWSLPIALPQRTVVAFEPSDASELIVSSDLVDGSVRIPLTTKPGEITGWAAYVAGVVWALRERRASGAGRGDVDCQRGRDGLGLVVLGGAGMRCAGRVDFRPSHRPAGSGAAGPARGERICRRPNGFARPDFVAVRCGVDGAADRLS